MEEFYTQVLLQMEDSELQKVQQWFFLKFLPIDLCGKRVSKNGIQYASIQRLIFKRVMKTM